MSIIIKPPVGGGGGGGAVDSVNGQTGVVVLTTNNISAGNNADRQYWTSSLQTSLNAKALQTDLSALDGRVDTAESDIDTLQTDLSALDGRVDTAESDIDSLQANRLYSNSFYVNDGINDIQTVHDDASFGQGDVIFVSSGSYGGSTLSLTKSNFSILPPPTGIGSICELAGGRGLTISGVDCTRVRIRSLQIEGNTLINGTLGRHYFKSVYFLGTTTITNGTSNFITFEDCEFSGSITIASNVSATIYFNRCSFGGVAISSSLVNPLQCILADCSGINASQSNLIGLVFAGRTAFANNVVSQYTSNSKYVYNLITGATTSFSGSYSELRDQPTIPSAYTDEQARDSAGTALANGVHTGISFSNDDGNDRINATVSLSSFDTDDLSEGTTNLYFTDSRADARITAQKGENNGICELDANGLVPTNHLPPLAITDVHVVADEAARLALVAQEGDVAIQQDDSSSWIYDGTSWVAFGISGGVLSVNGSTGVVSLTTSDINEGTNLYYTTTRFDDRLATKTTDNLSEGSTNQYFTTTRARSAFSAGTGISISSGQISSTITQYTDSNAKSAVVVDSMAGSQTDQAPSVSSVKTYYNAGTGISISSGQISSTITQYTDSNAKSAAVVNSMAGSQTDQAPSVSSVKAYYTAGTGISISSGQISASLASFSIDALSDVDTSTTPPTNQQALAWSSAQSKWIPTTISAGSSLAKPTVTDKTANYTILTPSENIYQEIYTISGASAVTITLPDATLCAGVRYDIKRLGSATTTIACNGAQTIDGLATVQLLAQYVNATVISTGSNWILI
jgi:hypothetical protein